MHVYIYISFIYRQPWVLISRETVKFIHQSDFKHKTQETLFKELEHKIQKANELCPTKMQMENYLSYKSIFLNIFSISQLYSPKWWSDCLKIFLLMLNVFCTSEIVPETSCGSDVERAEI